MKTLKPVLTMLAFCAALLSFAAQAQLQNLAVEILPSAARSAAEVVSTDQTNSGWRGAHIIVNVSAFSSGTYTLYVQGKDPVSGTYYNILVGSALAATGISIYKIYPGISTVANGSAADILPRIWRVRFVGAATPTMTFSVGAVMQN